MEDLIRVDILTKGRIPWMNIYGPIYNVAISKRLYTLLSENKNIVIRKVGEKDNGTSESMKMTDSIQITPMPTELKNNTPSVELAEETPEDLQTIEPTVAEMTEEDSEIESVLEETAAEEDPFSVDVEKLSDENLETVDAVVEAPLKWDYTRDELTALTKRELREILRARNLTGDLAPKYHDNHGELLEKVLKSQTEN